MARVSSSGRLVIGDFATVMCGALRSGDGTSLFDAFGQQNYKPEWPQVNSEKCIDERPITKDCQSARPTRIAYGVRTNPCTTFAESR
jgi:hypothetical protein